MGATAVFGQASLVVGFGLGCGRLPEPSAVSVFLTIMRLDDGAWARNASKSVDGIQS